MIASLYQSGSESGMVVPLLVATFHVTDESGKLFLKRWPLPQRLSASDPPAARQGVTLTFPALLVCPLTLTVSGKSPCVSPDGTVMLACHKPTKSGASWAEI